MDALGAGAVGSERPSRHRPPARSRPRVLALRRGGQPFRAPASPMATRVLTMSARLGPVQQPEEPVFAQLKPVLGAREAAIFPGEDLKQQQPPPQPQQQHPGGGGGGANLPAEEMVQVGAAPLTAPGLSVPAQLPHTALAPPGAAGLGGAGPGRRTPSAGVRRRRESLCVCCVCVLCVSVSVRVRGAAPPPIPPVRSGAERERCRVPPAVPGRARGRRGERGCPAGVLKATAAAFALARRQN